MIYDELVKTTSLRIIYRGSKWDALRPERSISCIVMNHQCEEERDGLLCSESEGVSEMWGHFGDCWSGTR